MVLHQLGSACNFSGSCHVDSCSVCQILPGAPHHDLWELRSIGYMEYWKCAIPVCSRGALQQLTVLAQNRENHGKNIWCFPQIFPHVFQFFFQMFKVSHVFHHLFPSFSPFLSSMFSHFSPMKFTIPGEAKPWWNFPSSEMVSRLRFRLHDKISWMLRAPKGSERIRKARNLWCGTFWIIGHDWSLKVWMDSIQVVWYESTFWIDMTSLEHIIFNSKFGPAKRKNEKCKRKNTTTTRITHAKYLEKREINIMFLSQNSWNITGKRNRQMFL